MRKDVERFKELIIELNSLYDKMHYKDKIKANKIVYEVVGDPGPPNIFDCLEEMEKEQEKVDGNA